MSLFLSTCPSLVDTFRIGTHSLFKIYIYISHFLTVFHLTVARLLLSLIGLETSFYLFFPAIASGLSIYTYSMPVLSPFWSGLSIFTHSMPVLTPFWSGLSIFTHSMPVLTPLCSGLSIYTHSLPVLSFFRLSPRMVQTSFLPLHLFLTFSLFYTWRKLHFRPCISFGCIRL